MLQRWVNLLQVPRNTLVKTRPFDIRSIQRRAIAQAWPKSRLDFTVCSVNFLFWFPSIPRYLSLRVPIQLKILELTWSTQLKYWYQILSFGCEGLRSRSPSVLKKCQSLCLFGSSRSVWSCHHDPGLLAQSDLRFHMQLLNLLLMMRFPISW